MPPVMHNPDFWAKAPITSPTNNDIYSGARKAAGPVSPILINEGLINRKRSIRMARKGIK
jgi:hypothetical protein